MKNKQINFDVDQGYLNELEYQKNRKRRILKALSPVSTTASALAAPITIPANIISGSGKLGAKIGSPLGLPGETVGYTAGTIGGTAATAMIPKLVGEKLFPHLKGKSIRSGLAGAAVLVPTTIVAKGLSNMGKNFRDARNMQLEDLSKLKTALNPTKYYLIEERSKKDVDLVGSRSGYANKTKAIEVAEEYESRSDYNIHVQLGSTAARNWPFKFTVNKLKV